MTGESSKSTGMSSPTARFAKVDVILAMALVISLVGASAIPSALAYRSDWEKHDGRQIMGGVKGWLNVLNPGSITCSNLDAHCLYESYISYYHAADESNVGAVGSGWLKMKDAGGNWRTWDAFYMNDIPISYKVYTLAYDETSTSKPITRSFLVYRTANDETGNDWARFVKTTGGTTLYNDFVTFTKFHLGHPRISAWTTSSSNYLGDSTNAQYYQNVYGKETTTSNWNSWGYQTQTNLCTTNSPYYVHMHTDVTAHMGPPTPTGESNSCSGLGSTDAVD
ncbi:MAG: hypothetical protein HRF40_02600 [Nitrososphaera sp.]|jgi:hypothetical protein